MKGIRIPLRERFERRIMPLPWSGCWIWLGGVDKGGYGRIGVGGWHGPNILTHRASWEIYKGEIPVGMCVLHKCDTPPCCNPEHLFLGTRIDNVEDMTRKGRRRSGIGERCGAAKLTSEQVLKIRSDNRTLAVIGKEYGICASQASNVRRGLHWKHI